MRILITGGAGFIGCNLAAACIRAGHQVTIFDNLSRRGSSANLAWLREQFGDSFAVDVGDIREAAAIERAARGQEAVYHLAAQTAVTTSVTDPRTDFEINALGTFNVLEAARKAGEDPVFIYSSTNKVYGGMEDAPAVERATRYELPDYPRGVGEARPLDFHSPYGCSKGAADQYVRDYARIYGLRSVVFRQSCIYGQRQMGVEDQGWVAWFIIAAVTGQPITIYGDGKQVRDLLHVDDLVAAFLAATERIDATRGQVYNLGGGPQNTLSIWAEFGPLLAETLGKAIIPAAFKDWRPGDQPVFIADIAKAKAEFGWQPHIGVREGIARLARWVEDNRELFASSGG
ncbi:MAG: CDP-paratose 2-epimerase [Chloroflexi bacterium ADurb.Bin325]|nr:MAG: CDP-paratose 2-epimerase [Chloroflexi bacterium ADurb.Bin325]